MTVSKIKGRLPPLPKFRSRKSDVFTAAQAQRILKQHGFRPETEEETQKLLAAGIIRLPPG